MRKVTKRITWALVLLFAGLLAWNVGAAAPTGGLTTEPRANYTLVQKVIWLKCVYPECVVRTPDGYACQRVNGVPPKKCPPPM
jgi:hypothetical protein